MHTHTPTHTHHFAICQFCFTALLTYYTILDSEKKREKSIQGLLETH